MTHTRRHTLETEVALDVQRNTLCTFTWQSRHRRAKARCEASVTPTYIYSEQVGRNLELTYQCRNEALPGQPRCTRHQNGKTLPWKTLKEQAIGN